MRRMVFMSTGAPGERLVLHNPFEVSTDLFGYPYGPAAVAPPDHALASGRFPVSSV